MPLASRHFQGSAVVQPPKTAVESLRKLLRGPLILPDMDPYNTARRVWNAAVDRHPSLIVQCLGVHDVRQSILFAQEHPVPISIRGGGHSYPGHSVGDGCLVIDLSRMKSIWVDPRRRRVRAEAGVLWRELDHETHGVGLAVTGSQVSQVGIAGLTLGGGLGWLMRKWGLTIDSLVSANVINADGELRVASAQGNPDLFWALRGGGGNFGVVTSFEYQLYPLETVFGGAISFPLHSAKSVFQYYREFVAAARDELSTTIAFLTSPDHQRVVTIAVCYIGDPAAGERLLQPLRRFGVATREQFGLMPYPVLQTQVDQALPPGSRVNVRSNFLADFPDGLVEVLAEHYGRAPSPHTSIVALQMGGAVSRVDPQATAFYHRNAAFSLNLFSAWAKAEDDSQNNDWLEDVWLGIQPFLGDGVYVNVLVDEGQNRVRAAYGGNYARLVELKQRYDPHNLLRLNQNIPNQ